MHKSIAILTLLCATLPAQNYLGPGHTTATCRDDDGDGYGVGDCPNGADADDADAAVNTTASVLAKYGSISAFMQHLGYSPGGAVYVSPTGNDKTCKREKDISIDTSACATHAKAVSMLHSGDVLFWRGGTYPETTTVFAIGGTAGHPTIFMAYPGEKPILDYSAQGDRDGFRGNGLSYYTLDGLVFKGPSNGYGLATQQYEAVKGVTVRNTEVNRFYDNVFFMNNMTGTLIEHSVFRNTDINGEHNLYIGNSANPSPDLTIRNNIIYGAGAGGGHNIHLNGRFTNAVVSGNIMYQSLNSCLGLQEGVNHSRFENNVCFTTSGHSPIFVYDYQDGNPLIKPYDQNYNTFRNNTFYYDGAYFNTGYIACDQRVYWARDDSKAGGHDLGHNIFDNNIFYTACTNGSSSALRYDTDIEGNGGKTWLATDTWRNNIIATAASYGDGFVRIGNYKQDSFSNMTYSEFDAAIAAGKGSNLQSNPQFVAANPNWFKLPQLFDLRTRPGSLANGAGLASDAPERDIRGTARGSRPDIGAYQSPAPSASLRRGMAQ
jgi:hypothetical protein